MDWTWAGPPIDARPLFPLERAELISLLRSLDGGDWQRATVCPDWSVHDIVAHIAHDYPRKLARTRDGYLSQGPRPGEDLPAFLHRLNQEFVDVAAAWSPQILIDLIDHLGPQLDLLWAGMDLDRLGEAVSWAAPGVSAPVWLDIAREYSEFWVHQQQIRDAVARPGANEERLTAPVIDTFLRAVPYALRDVPAGPGSGVEITVSGPGGGTWNTRLGETGWAISRGPAREAAHATVVVSSDTLWRVATRGIGVTDACARATISGDQALGAAALSLISIIR
ncbi:MAG: maleylpyruvate isomerase family mycothiol-dependent enzyme [Streptosporangiaceae bacterium]